MNKKTLSQAMGNISDKYILEALAAESRARLAGKGKKAGGLRRTGRTLLIAAALILALAAAATAVYQHSVKDAVMEDVLSVNYTREGELVLEPKARLSLNGFSDSPEYQAYMEWENYLAQWKAENPNWFNDLGVDDSYHEVPDSYYHIYGLYAQEQADKLDEIMAKYGLTAHTERADFYTERQLCRALGIKDLLSDEYDTVGEYLFDDGSFRLDAELTVDGHDFWMTCVNAVKGSITMTADNVPEEYEQWTYTTSRGREVLMLSYDGGARMIADLGGSYVTAHFMVWLPDYGEDTSLTREQAQALVEGIDLETLADCFADERARGKVKESVAAFIENKGSATTTDNMEEGAEIVLDILGNYYLSVLPEGHSLWRTDYTLPDTVDESGYYGITHWYTGIPAEVTLSYRSLKEGETALEFSTPERLEMMFAVETPCTVKGYDGICTKFNAESDQPSYSYRWLDTDRELVFSVGTSGFFTAEEMLAFAESATAENPALETGSAAYAARAARHQAEIDALTDASWAEFEAYLAETEAELKNALAKLGDYNITKLSRPADNVFSNPVLALMDNGKEYGYFMDVRKSYSDGDIGGVNLAYTRYWSREDESVFINDREFARLRDVRYGEELDPVMESHIKCPPINGYEAFLANEFGAQTLVWYDTDRELIFELTRFCETEADALTAEELIALAESVA